MDKILLSKLIENIGVPENDCYITQVTSDSRNVGENSVFLAIQGERVNGEDYAAAALEKGARLVLTEHHLDNIPDSAQCVVKNILDASIQMGANVRKTYDLTVIGVTGSVGKTGTKDFVYAAISPFVKTVRSLGNQNNELGMPQTIYGFTHEDKFAILEMGMAHFDDVHKLSMAAKPKAAVISCIGVSHLQEMKTQENILKAKLEICHGMPSDGILVLNGDDKFLSKAEIENPKNVFYFAIDNKNADVRAENIQQKKYSTEFDIVDKANGRLHCVIPTVGMHNVMNALSAYTVVTRLGFDCEKTADNLGEYAPSGMRQKLVEKDGILFVEDCYNASPDSMHAAVNVLDSLEGKRKIAVFGDMLELGTQSAEMHTEVGKYAKNHGVDCMWCFGDMSKYICGGYGEGAVHFESKKELADYIKANITQGDVVIFKASNGMRFGEIIEQVYEK